MKTKQLNYINPMPAAEMENNEFNAMMLRVLVVTAIVGIALVTLAYFGG